MTRTADVTSLLTRLLAGERRALARALTLVEDGGPDELRAVVAGLHPEGGDARLIGITGPPGVGKSTLTNALVAELRSRGNTVAVVAVDPSSPFTGGALLGDRVRMQSHHADDGVFIRSMAARGHLGGIAFATPHALAVLDAAGFDIVIVETVGVGQSEVEVASAADSTVVVVAPGMGDSVQAAKAGILEVADLYVINKSDHPGAGRTLSELTGMLDVGHATGHEGAWRPPIIRTVASEGTGVSELADALDAHREFLVSSGALVERRRARALHAIREIALAAVRGRFVGLERGGNPLLETLAEKVSDHAIDPYAAADELLAALD